MKYEPLPTVKSANILNHEYYVQGKMKHFKSGQNDILRHFTVKQLSDI
jgi:hypothetical protein